MIKRIIFPIALTLLAFCIVAGLFFLDRTIYVGKNSFREATSTINSTTSRSEVVASTAIKENENYIPNQETLLEIQRYIEDNEAVREEPLKRADNVKALYMTQFVANSPNSQLFKNIEKLINETEINAVVIDIKESEGPYLPQSLKKTIDKFHEQGVWVIARICAFRDSSQISKNPQWYIKKEVISTTTDKTVSTSSGQATTTSFEIWKDSGGRYWLDPASLGARNYIIDFSKKAIDFGFDELQFDYVRFPSDGDLKNIIYPVYDQKLPKYEIMKDFFLNVSGQLRRYNPSVILSVDLFGYVSTQYQALEIGQRIKDISGLFDYVSFMLYPSHYYSGFIIPEDVARDLPALNFPYNTASPTQAVANHPYEVILRSVLSASDYLENIESTTKIRPWLQDFDLRHDTNMGIYYNTDRVGAQIMAAEDAGAFGWMLWSSSNVYTAEALKQD